MRRQRTKPEVMACVVLALGVAFWIWRDGEDSSGIAAEGKVPRVTKPYPRERDARERRTKNPRDEFEAARKRGLTEEEVRRVVEEYIESVAWEDQSDLPLEKVLHILGEKRVDVYLNALIEGLNLSQYQISAVQAKLPALANHHVSRSLLLASVDKAWESSVPAEEDDVSSKDTTLTRLEQMKAVATSPLHLTDGGRPWDLVGLSETQKEMLGYYDENGQWTWVDGGGRTFDFGTTESYADLSDPFADGATVMDTAGKVFPLSMWQVERLGDFENESVSPHSPKTKSGGKLDRVMYLTQAQLRTLLLFKPEMAGDLMKELGE